MHLAHLGIVSKGRTVGHRLRSGTAYHVLQLVESSAVQHNLVEEEQDVMRHCQRLILVLERRELHAAVKILLQYGWKQTQDELRFARALAFTGQHEHQLIHYVKPQGTSQETNQPQSEPFEQEVRICALLQVQMMKDLSNVVRTTIPGLQPVHIRLHGVIRR